MTLDCSSLSNCLPSLRRQDRVSSVDISDLLKWYLLLLLKVDTPGVASLGRKGAGKNV